MDQHFDLNGYKFGAGHPVTVIEWDRGTREIAPTDVLAMSGGSYLMGRDLPEPPEWTFVFSVRGSDATTTAEHLRALQLAWDAVRAPGQTVRLQFPTPDGPRFVIGRPRRFTPISTPQTLRAGQADAMATFQLSDVRMFDAALRTTSISTVPESTGGLIAPLVTPLTTVARGGIRAGIVRNDGNAPAPLTIEFTGPCSNPRIYTPAWEVGITGDLAWDNTATIDSLALTVTSETGASIGGRLTRATRLRNAALTVGQSELTFTAVDQTGTALANITWRNTWWAF